MNYNSSEGKIFFAEFHFINIKENWSEKNSRPGAKITTIIGLL